MRSAALVLTELLDLLPPTWLCTRERDSATADMLLPIAAEWSLVEASAEAMLTEIDPRSAYSLLPDYERVLGPDPCGRDALTLTIADRQRLAYQRWTARGGQSPAYYVTLAAAMGVPITVTEYHPSVCGGVCGMTLVKTPQQYFWRVQLPLSRLVLAYAGEMVCGDYLSAFTPNLVECAIRAAAPAHTTVVFSYI